jgi:hypothetical protein
MADARKKPGGLPGSIRQIAGRLPAQMSMVRVDMAEKCMGDKIRVSVAMPRFHRLIFFLFSNPLWESSADPAVLA